MIDYWVTLFCVGTVLHRPFWKWFISDTAMEKNKGRTALVFFGTGIYMGKSPETQKGDDDCCGRQASVKSFVKRQRGRIWPCGTLCLRLEHHPDSEDIQKSSCELSKALLLSRSAPGCSKLCSWMLQALFLDAPSSAPGCSKPAVSNGRAGPKPRGAHLQVWRQGTLNHTCNCTSHTLRVISQLLENSLGLVCKAGWPHWNHLWGRTLVPCSSPSHTQGKFKRQTIRAKP